MDEATKTLGKFLTVRQDGKGDFKTIQAAIDAAPRMSAIEIQDAGPYVEQLEIAPGKDDLSLYGRLGTWPCITSNGLKQPVARLVSTSAAGTRFASLVFAHYNVFGYGMALAIEGPRCEVRRCIVFWTGGTWLWANRNALVDTCVAGPVAGRDYTIRNSIVLGTVGYLDEVPKAHNVLVIGGVGGAPGSEFAYCTITGQASLPKERVALRDCIVAQVSASGQDCPVENCDVFGKPPFVEKAKRGKGCFSADPQFRDPANFDYRLKPTSPCRRKATDGGDIGCRYTPEMLEVLEKALELRKKGIIKF
jgi:hypothetical protein